MQDLIWVCAWSLGSHTDLRACLEALTGAQLLVYPWQQTGPSLFGEGHPLRLTVHLQEEHTWSNEGGRGHPPNQPDKPNQPW